MHNLWENKINKIIKLADSRLLSPKGLSDLIDDSCKESSPISFISITISTTDGPNMNIGTPGEGECSSLSTSTLKGSRHKEVRFQIWNNKNLDQSEYISEETIKEKLGELIRVWWGDESRTKGDLFPWNDEIKKRGDTILSEYRKKNFDNNFCILFCDLDNFKNINNEFGQKGGDQVIQRVATFLEEFTDIDSLIIQHGGDEYVIVMPEAQYHDAIYLSAKLIDASSKFDFKSGEHKIAFSIGITCASDHPSLSFTDLVDKADVDVMKKLVKDDPNVKGAMRISADAQPLKNWSDGVNRDVLALLLRHHITTAQFGYVFPNAWLNALVKAGRNKYEETRDIFAVGPEIVNMFNTFKIPLHKTDYSCIPPCDRPITAPLLSTIDIAAACARVLFEILLSDGPAQDDGPMMVKANAARTIIELNGKEYFNLDQPYHANAEVNLGIPWKIDSTDNNGTVEASPFILIEIGRNGFKGLSKLAADHIVIDDRPVLGGGLPDFWELSLSKLFTRLNKFPNADCIIVIGERACGEKTASKLLDPDSWDIDHLTYKTSVPKTLITEAQTRLKGKVFLHSSEEDALVTLAPFAQASKTLKSVNTDDTSTTSSLLPRALNYPGAALQPTDGCRIKTAAEAYPLVLELLRSDADPDDIVIDQDGLELRELVDYKIVIEEPNQLKVPLFFKTEKKDLEKYYEQQFLDPAGKFGKELTETKAEENLLKHVAWALTPEDGRPFATRRALLVMPHELDSEPQKVSPPGLVSIRMLPRLTENGHTINFSFTWRTVEALVGLPYSLYGSIRYSEHLIEKLRDLLPTTLKINHGYVSYVAHSLHFFMSDEAHRIARGIVNESSK